MNYHLLMLYVYGSLDAEWSGRQELIDGINRAIDYATLSLFGHYNDLVNVTVGVNDQTVTIQLSGLLAGPQYKSDRRIEVTFHLQGLLTCALCLSDEAAPIPSTGHPGDGRKQAVAVARFYRTHQDMIDKTAVLSTYAIPCV